MRSSLSQQWFSVRPIAAGLLAVVLGGLSLLAPQESIAHALEANAHHDGGSCFVCLLSHGQLDQPSPGGVTVDWQAKVLAPTVLAPHLPVTSNKSLLPPGRGPPPQLASSPQVES